MSTAQAFFLYGLAPGEHVDERLKTLPRNLEAAEFIVEGILKRGPSTRSTRLVTHTRYADTIGDVTLLSKNVQTALALPSLQTGLDPRLYNPGLMTEDMFESPLYSMQGELGNAANIILVTPPDVFSVVATQMGFAHPMYHDHTAYLLQAERDDDSSEIESLAEYRFTLPRVAP